MEEYEEVAREATHWGNSESREESQREGDLERNPYDGEVTHIRHRCFIWFGNVTLDGAMTEIRR